MIDKYNINTIFTNMTEIEILTPQASDLNIKVGNFYNQEKIEKLQPVFDTRGGLMYVHMIGCGKQILGTLTVYGVPCFIK